MSNDGDGRDPDPSDPGNWVTEEQVAAWPRSNCRAGESRWHGTAVAGTATGAAFDGVGTAGVAPEALLLPVRVIGRCGALDRDLEDAILWAAGLPVPDVPANRHPARVINLSLGRDDACPPSLQGAIDAARSRGVVVVASAGNSKIDAARHRPSSCVGVVAVAATDEHGSLASFSNFGPSVTLSAPGVSILSPVDTGTTVPVAPGWAYRQGTSFAAPIVSGVLALLFSARPTLSEAAALEALRTTASPFPAGSDCVPGRCGAGVVNAFSALRRVVDATPGAVVDPAGVEVRVSGTDLLVTARSGAAGYRWYRDGTLLAESLVAEFRDAGQAEQPGRFVYQVGALDAAGLEVSLGTVAFAVKVPPRAGVATVSKRAGRMVFDVRLAPATARPARWCLWQDEVEIACAEARRRRLVVMSLTSPSPVFVVVQTHSGASRRLVNRVR